MGRKAEGVERGLKGTELLPPRVDAVSGTYFKHQLVRIYILAGDMEKALDTLEPLLKRPYYLSPAWLRIDPTFDPLRKHPRFEQLAKGTT